jgi:hypothetical protein
MKGNKETYKLVQRNFERKQNYENERVQTAREFSSKKTQKSLQKIHLQGSPPSKNTENLEEIDYEIYSKTLKYSNASSSSFKEKIQRLPSFSLLKTSNTNSISPQKKLRKSQTQFISHKNSLSNSFTNLNLNEAEQDKEKPSESPLKALKSSKSQSNILYAKAKEATNTGSEYPIIPSSFLPSPTDSKNKNGFSFSEEKKHKQHQKLLSKLKDRTKALSKSTVKTIHQNISLFKTYFSHSHSQTAESANTANSQPMLKTYSHWPTNNNNITESDYPQVQDKSLKRSQSAQKYAGKNSHFSGLHLKEQNDARKVNPLFKNQYPLNLDGKNEKMDLAGSKSMREKADLSATLGSLSLNRNLNSKECGRLKNGLEKNDTLDFNCQSERHRVLGQSNYGELKMRTMDDVNLEKNGQIGEGDISEFLNNSPEIGKRLKNEASLRAKNWNNSTCNLPIAEGSNNQNEVKYVYSNKSGKTQRMIKLVRGMTRNQSSNSLGKRPNFTYLNQAFTLKEGLHVRINTMFSTTKINPSLRKLDFDKL